MRKILFLALLSFVFCGKAYCFSANNFDIPRSTVISQNDIGSVMISTGHIYLESYQVLSTATAASMNIYDTTLTTTAGVAAGAKSYTGFPLTTFYPIFPLEIYCSSGAAIVNTGGSSGARVRVFWRKIVR